MIEIKSRWGSKVLYTAENAADIRHALEGAVSAGADLAGAYLVGAYLVDADLAGANLAGANLADAHLARADLARADLARANLAGAYLADANLADANLADADLVDADLAGADLADADLAGANLAGANLVGAYLAGALWRQVAEKLRQALASMNDNGRHWIKGALSKALDDGSTAYCSIGSVEACADGTIRTLALWLLNQAAAGPVENFNDHDLTTWDDVVALFGVAIRNAERFAA